jgi:hypothetical protein
MLIMATAPTLFGIFPYAGLKFYFYEEMKRHVPEDYKKKHRGETHMWIRGRFIGPDIHILLKLSGGKCR